MTLTGSKIHRNLAQPPVSVYDIYVYLQQSKVFVISNEITVNGCIVQSIMILLYGYLYRLKSRVGNICFAGIKKSNWEMPYIRVGRARTVHQNYMALCLAFPQTSYYTRSRMESLGRFNMLYLPTPLPKDSRNKPLSKNTTSCKVIPGILLSQTYYGASSAQYCNRILVSTWGQ